MKFYLYSVKIVQLVNFMNQPTVYEGTKLIDSEHKIHCIITLMEDKKFTVVSTDLFDDLEFEK
jgi:hypothetical protein